MTHHESDDGRSWGPPGTWTCPNSKPWPSCRTDFIPSPQNCLRRKHTGWNVLDSSKQLDAVHFLIPNLPPKNPSSIINPYQFTVHWLILQPMPTMHRPHQPPRAAVDAESSGMPPDQFHFRLLDSLVHVVSEPRSRCSHHSWGFPYLWGYPKRALDGFCWGEIHL